MRILIPRESRPGERRVAVMPAVVGRYKQAGFDVLVEEGAGLGALVTDADLTTAGALIVPSDRMDDTLPAVDVVASVRPLSYHRASRLRKGAVTVSFLSPATDEETVRGVHDAGASALSFDRLPRISRAQPMDALTSQALVAGYRATIVAADLLPRFMPLFMTAAGTVQPARVLVLGAGVAGLQAMGTAKRLGARVWAYDVRPESAEEVRSMGATFIELDLDTLAGTGGYAREMSEDRAQRQRDLLAPHIADMDAVITTAAVPGRQAPLLVSRSMVEAMRPGSVVVDLASESGGNVEGSVAGEQVRVGEATVWGALDVPSQMPVDASALYSMNVHALVGVLLKEGAVTLDLEDEILAGCAVVANGEVRI